MKRLLIVLSFALLACVVVAAATQTPSPARVPFSAEDMLKVSTVSVADLSDDGGRVAVTLRRSYDNAEVDNYRSGDPTYVAP